jgi:transaldolase
MPEATLVAIADHGVVAGDTLSGRSATSAAVWSQLALIGIDQGEVLAELETAGVAAFERAWVELLASLADRLADNAIG